MEASQETPLGWKLLIGRIVAYVMASALLLGLGILAGYGFATHGLNMDKTVVWIGDWSKTAGFGGCAALVAALIALGAQRGNTRGAAINAERARATARENALRKEWWDRTAWCLEQIQDTDALTRSMGINTLKVQFESGTNDERLMLRPVILAVQKADEAREGRKLSARFRATKSTESS